MNVHCISLYINNVKRMRVLRQQHHAHVLIMDCLRGLSQKRRNRKVIFLVLCAHKKYSRSFCKFTVEPPMSRGLCILMLSLISFCALIVVGHNCCPLRFNEHLDFIKNNLICVPKMNKGLMYLERHEGE